MDKKNRSQKEKKKEPSWMDWIPFFISAIVILVILGLNIKFLLNSSSGDTLGERGTFGDMFGASNALFSGLAFAGIIWTMIQQRKELKLQRDELQLTREEFKGQNQTMALQRFENSFFNLMNQLHLVQNNFTSNDRNGPKGRSLLQKRSQYIHHSIGGKNLNLQGKDWKTARQQHLDGHLNGVDGKIFAPWVSLVKQILQLIDSQVPKGMEGEFDFHNYYISVLFTTIHEDEARWLIYATWYKKGVDPYLIKKYNLFSDRHNYLAEEELKAFNEWLEKETSNLIS